jgi:hypothetical protein
LGGCLEKSGASSKSPVIVGDHEAEDLQLKTPRALMTLK